MAKIDLYQEVTNQIISLLEEGSLTFDSGFLKGGMPRNAVSGRPYSGVNMLLLSGSAVRFGFSSNRWLTYKQAIAAGGNVKKGSKGILVIYFAILDVKDEETGEDKKLPMLKKFTVFNLDQCENLPEELTTLPAATDEKIDVAAIEKLAEDFGVLIKHGETVANPCYVPSGDFIKMPNKERFTSAANYYATLLHEMTHATGHKKRLNRDFSGRFGSEAYAFEELIAELGSAFMCAEYGLIGATVENHAAYIENWLGILKSDKRAIFTASAQAAKAAEFLKAITSH